MATLRQDIKKQSDWIVKAFKADNFKLDYTIDSFKQIDRFFDLHSKDGEAVPGGRLSEHPGPILFSIGAYIGETFIKLAPDAAWVTDDNDPEGEINAAVRFADGGEVWPMQRVIKRFKNGAEDGLYAYGHLLKDHVKITAPPSRPWWKFWSVL